MRLNQRAAEMVSNLGARFTQAQEVASRPNVTEFPPPRVDQYSRVRDVNLEPGEGEGNVDWQYTNLDTMQRETTPARRVTPPEPLQVAGRWIGQGLGMALEAWGLPAKGFERVQGAIAANTTPITMPVVLPGGKTFTPPEPLKTGVPPYLAQQIALGGDNPTLRQAVVQTYGDTPESQAAIRQVERIMYSGPEAQLMAVARMLDFGQTPEAAMYGNGNIVAEKLMDAGWANDRLGAVEKTPEVKYWFDRRVQELIDKGASVELARNLAFDQIDRQGLPGEQHLPAELLGQIVMDPLNLVGGTGLTDDLLRAARVKWAMNIFAPVADEVGDVLAASRRELHPSLEIFGKKISLENAPFVRTPTAVAEEFADLGRDATGVLLTQAGKVEGEKLENVLEAYVRQADPRPVRADFPSEEGFLLAEAAWEARKPVIAAALAPFPTATSRGGKIGAALTRELMLDSTGRVSRRALADLVKEGDAADIAVKLFDRVNEAVTNLLMPERMGAKTIEEFVERTGRPAKEFPVFERFLRGAQERVRLGRGAEQAGIDYAVSPATRALAGWAGFQDTVNQGLWRLFAEFTPAYTVRNFLNNLITILTDRTLSWVGGQKIDAFFDLIGKPIAAERGIGLAGALPGRATSRGFAGTWKPFGIPVGAQAVEQAFSRNVTYTVAKDYLDRILEVGKGIPYLPGDVEAVLGEDVARGLLAEFRRTYGDVEATLKWIKKQRGQAEIWRIPSEGELEALRAARAAPKDLDESVLEILRTSKTPDELRQRLAALRQKLGKAAEQTARSVPPVLPPGSPEYSFMLAEMSNPLPGDAPKTFNEFLARRRMEVAEAEGIAFESIQRLESKADYANGRQNFADAKRLLDVTYEDVAKGLDELRDSTWAQYREIQAKKGMSREAKNAHADEIWRYYFSERTRRWTEAHEFAVQTWRELAAQPVLTLPTGTVASVAEAEQRAQAGAARTQEIGAAEEALTNAQAERQASIEARTRGLSEIKRQYFTYSAGEYRPKTLWLNRYTGDWLPYGQRRPAGGTWVKTPASEVLGWSDRVVQQARESGIEVEDIEGLIRVIDQETGLNNSIRKLEDEAVRLKARLKELKAAARDEASRIGPVHQERDAVEARIKANNLRLSAAIQARGPTAVPVLPTLVEQPALMGAGKTLGTGFAPPVPKLPGDLGAILGRIENYATQNWGRTQPLNMTPEAWKSLQSWAELARSQANLHKGLAGQVGTAGRDFALLNYGKKFNIDSWLGVVAPYQFWYGRTYANWLKRAVLNPGALANYGRYRQALATLHAGLPEYQRQQLTTEDVGIPMDNPLMFNLEATLSPLYSILGEQFSDPNRRRAKMFGVDGVGALAEDVGQFGPSLWAPIIWAMALSNIRDDPEASAAWMGYLGQPARAARGLTAVLGAAAPGLNIPPGGYNLDPQMIVRNLTTNNKSGLTQFEANRVANEIFKLWENPPDGVALKDWQAQIGDQFTAQRGPLWDKAVREMFVNTAPAVMASFILGLGFKGRGKEELEFLKILEEQRFVRAHYGDWDAERIALEHNQIRERHPMVDVLMLARAQGPDRDNRLVWDASSRTGVDNYPIWEVVGVSQSALDAFYQNKTVEGMPQALRDELVAGALGLNARLRPRTAEEQRASIQARAAKADLNAQLAREFGPDTFALEREFYEAAEISDEAAQAVLDKLPVGDRARLEGMWNARRATEVNDPNLAAYADVEMYQAYAKDQFYTEADRKWKGIQAVNDALKKVKEERGQAAASAFVKEHPELKEFLDAQSKFYEIDLPVQTKEWLKNLPEVPGLEIRQDQKAIGEIQESVDEYVQDQAGRYALPPTETVEEGGGQAIADQFLAQFDAKQALKDANTSYFDLDTPIGSARDVYETTLNSYFLGNQQFRDDPRLAQEAFEKVNGQWPAGMAGANLAGYLGENRDLRQAILFDTTNRWTSVVGYLLTLSPEQVEQMADGVPGLRPAWQQAQQWTEGPSEAARADIGGANVTFNIDGTVSVTRQSVKKYFGGEGVGTGAGAGGGGAGTGGPRVKRGVWPEGRDKNKYYGGEGPDLPGFPRRNIPYGGQYGPQPRPDRRYRRGGYNQGPDVRRREAGAFGNLIGSLPSELRDLVLEFLGSTPQQAAQLLAMSNALRTWLAGQDVEQLQGLFQAWLSGNQAQAGGEVGPPGSNGWPRFGPVVRVYPRRDGGGLY